MKRWIVGLVAVASLAFPTMAFAWSGGSVTDVSCPEVHLTLPVESGPWKVEAVVGAYSSSTLPTPFWSATVPGSQYPTVVGNFYTPTNAATIVTVAAGNAVNMSDGFQYKTVQLVDCAAPAGTPGPVGPAGPVGPQGSTGLTGLTGPVGPTGPIGPLGPAGPKGPSGKTGRPGKPGKPGKPGQPGKPTPPKKIKICHLPNGSTIICGHKPPPPIGRG